MVPNQEPVRLRGDFAGFKSGRLHAKETEKENGAADDTTPTSTDTALESSSNNNRDHADVSHHTHA